MHPHPPPDETPTLPPISSLTTLYASAPRLIFSLAYNPYAAVGPSSYASNASLTHPTCLQHCLPSLNSQCPPDMPLRPLTLLMLRYYIHRVRWLVGVHDEHNQGDMLSGHRCQQVLGGKW
ncbi:hypothetical protein O181_113230 [Austropuccinia psidii MF-1]|uniref:Uncharacterized protein n=1 Tax=Austropuccinia psidii MF-1 TaxID=1389203 RepID=A0A9Q3PUB0_9BASI|nr:hypothetical protein [Austropuccinia psidii MF-1]